MLQQKKGGSEDSVIPLDSLPAKRLTTRNGIAQAPLPTGSPLGQASGRQQESGGWQGMEHRFSQFPLPRLYLAVAEFLYLRPQLSSDNPLCLLASRVLPWKKISIQFLCPFFSLDLEGFFGYWVIWVLYVFWIWTHFPIYGLQKNSSHSAGCLFALLILCSAVQKI